MGAQRRRGAAALCISLLLFMGGLPWIGAQEQYDAPDQELNPNPEALPAMSTGLFTSGAILMTLVRSSSNWAAVTRAVPGFKGWDWPNSEPCETLQTSSWTGVACDGGMVVRIELQRLGLQGTLPPELFQLPGLTVLNLRRNLYSGTLPPQWASQTLASLDVSYNQLSGPLPVAYAVNNTFPRLRQLQLQGNRFSGPMTGPEWATGFAPQVVITLRPGNTGLCGRVPRMDASLFTALPLGATPVELSNSSYSALAPAGAPGLSTSYMMYEGIFGETVANSDPEAGASTRVLITNTLGTCADPCGRTVPVQTNLFDAAWANNVTLADLVRYNPGLAAYGADPGTALALPCYMDPPTQTNLGSDAARGQFAGGNQQGVSGTVGAMLAALMVDDSTADAPNASSTFYEGSREWAWADGGVTEPVTEPLFWFVDLQANFSIAAVTVTAGNAMWGISLYIGNSPRAVADNTLVASDLAFDPGQTRVLDGDDTWGRYVVLYAGDAGQGAMSLAHVRVWPSEGNAAFNKPVISSGPVVDLNSTSDGELTTCTAVSKGGEDTVWFAVDLGYIADVSTVILQLDGISENLTSDIYVTRGDTWGDASEDARCARGVPLHRGGGLGQVSVTCPRRGRFVLVAVPGTDSVQVCEMQVFLQDGPARMPTIVLEGTSSVLGVALGCAIGGASLALGATAMFVYLRRRRQRRVREALDSGGDSSEGTDIEHGNGLKRDSLGAGGSFTAKKGSPVGDGKGGLIAPGMMSARSLRPSISPTRAETAASIPTDLSRFGEGCDIVDYSQLELVRTIGEGSFGLVWMARYLQTTVAVKLLTHDAKRGVERESPSPAVMAALEKEASIMASLRHPNCVQYLGACLDPPGLIMEFCSRRSVDCILAAAAADAAQARQLNWVRLLNIATDSAKGMLYLHTRSPPVIHRDLKSPNLLVDALWHVKVSDFNLSRAMEPGATVSSIQITNPRWLAPEVLQGEQAGAPSDVFAFGVVLWELMTWSLPWGRDANPFVIINTVVAGRTLEVPPPNALRAGPLQCYDEYVALMQRCWARDPAARPGMGEVAQLLRGMLSGVVQSALDFRDAEDRSSSG